MISHKNERFEKLFVRLSMEIQEKTNMAYSIFKQDPFYPDLHFKCLRNKSLIGRISFMIHG